MFDVVIRTNGARSSLLRRAIQSIRDQSFAGWKIILVASSDAEAIRRQCLEVLPDLGEKIQVVPYQGEYSLGRALNVGIRTGTAPYVSILDDDDTWEPRFLEVMHGYLPEGPGLGYEGVVCQTRLVYENLHEGGIEERARAMMNADLKDVTIPDLLTNNRFTINAFCYPRTCFDALGGYDESLPVCEDWEFNLRFVRQYNVLVHSEALSNYHQRPPIDASLSNTVHSRSVAHRLARSRVVNDWFRRIIEGDARYGEMVVISQLVERVTEKIQSLERFDDSWKEKIGRIDSRTREMDGAMKKITAAIGRFEAELRERKRSFFSFFRK